MNDIIQFFVSFFTISIARYFIIAGIAFLLVYVLFARAMRKNKIQQKKASASDFRREILHSFSSNIIMIFVAIPFMLTPIKRYTLLYSNINDYGIFYLLASVAIALIIHDTYFYWMHRLLHHRRIFRYTHLLHHKSTNPSPWASYAFSMFEAFTEGLILPILLFMLPMHPISISLFVTAAFIINVYGHLGYEIAPKWFRKSFLFQILNTSVHHNLHHSKFKGNYGLYFRIWDRIMKTENPQYVAYYDQIQEQRFGSNAISLTLQMNNISELSSNTEKETIEGSRAISDRKRSA
ncbi:sterol desaturase family protein [Niabella sp. CJ426]|uniref:sterol desaturase family protein n=1 Tax=Niabella sp. CJ426 TaxID=3393740 RepID=UPI003D046E61